MKKAIYYPVLMIFILLILPLLIVKSCGISSSSPAPVKKSAASQIKLKVYVTADKKIVEMSLEDYVRGVVAAEMPAEFGLEALKAQAVAARTYAYGRMKKIYASSVDAHEGADVCTDPGHCQAWISKKAAIKKWGFLQGNRYWNKVDRAVRETDGVVITYQSQIINPLFHSNSGGKTENAEEVWPGVQVPYLRSVTSPGEENSKDYRNERLVTVKDFISTMKKEYPQIKLSQKNILNQIKISGLTTGGRVKILRVGNVTMEGTDFRKLFNLKSANFKIAAKDKNTLSITAIGNGHGVGMSQWGANYLAKNGATFVEILKFYYRGIELKKLKSGTGGSS